jgi:N-methylhydantoinase B/oxoprolinase/acetone carboxylase alpha subunit
MGDLDAQVAACNIGVRGLSELAAAYGHCDARRRVPGSAGRFGAMTRRHCAKSRKARIRTSIISTTTASTSISACGSKWRYSPRWHDPLRFHRDEQAGSWGLSIYVPSGSYAAACFAVRTVTDPDIPANEGCFRPIELVLPVGRC